ncbi:hypothetical protein APR41_14965 [Salegentibacter salinarum]|uniref:3-keto-alpha-glucoside-1,2-lyase/3-keto-2-hydroxy-glucal hydratase domain-containing protein n=1 Tax=Salegentibacter salinarum TaxID=447422 RepID=A0A2N0TZ28_9FLAO|nr:DUF1080 domain-containing protein [Salegentibacter salinarum]PKD19979.1 hypothetical protein APR41_14965 [Salegentibacter salinarum]SKB96912.1 protein of unknown function [Salegentibacter salinarum]
MRFILLLIFSLILFSCSNEKAEWTNLLDENLSQWDNYLSYHHKDGYNGEEPKDLQGNLIEPIGANKDQFGVFSVLEENEEQILKVSGEIYGCVSTKTEYENYHFRLKVKWGNNLYPPREKLLKDSGILYHSIGPNGADYWRSWMLSQEFQIMQGHMGDYWSQANSAIDIRTYPSEGIMSPVADNNQAFLPIGEGEVLDGYVMRSVNHEKPQGEWNTLELICFEDKSIHIVNGEVVMVLKNSRYVKEGEKIPLTKGKIQLQSEAAEVFYKDIQIKPLTSLPEIYGKYYN